jgi:hypothetical protein
MENSYVYFDCMWIICNAGWQIENVLDVGGRLEPLDFLPDSDALLMSYAVWQRNMDAISNG